jgi:hypothetical protein
MHPGRRIALADLQPLDAVYDFDFRMGPLENKKPRQAVHTIDPIFIGSGYRILQVPLTPLVPLTPSAGGRSAPQ